MMKRPDLEPFAEGKWGYATERELARYALALEAQLARMRKLVDGAWKKQHHLHERQPDGTVICHVAVPVRDLRAILDAPLQK